MSHSVIERFGCRVLGEAQDLTTVNPSEPAGARDQQEAQGAHAAEGKGEGALPGPRLGNGQGLELEAAEQVVGEHAEMLPGAVRPVVVRGHDVEGELAPLELPIGLLLGASAGDEGPQGGGSQRLVGRDRRGLSETGRTRSTRNTRRPGRRDRAGSSSGSPSGPVTSRIPTETALRLEPWGLTLRVVGVGTPIRYQPPMTEEKRP
jgi:hypothetical protein